MGRFLLIGLDGAEPRLLRPWMRQGRLPALTRIAGGGSMLDCTSTTPPATFPAWTTCVTGVNPGRHGIVDFTEVIPGRRAIRFVNAARRMAPPIWQVLSQAGKRVCVLGVPATYPPEPVNGVMVSGFDSPVATGVDRSFVSPAEAWPLVKDWRFADFQETHIGPGWHEMALDRLLHGIATKERIACSLLEREPWDFFMLVFGESDTVSHHFWMFHDENSPRHEPRLQDAILRVYERLDRAVAALLECVDSDTTVGIVSDHGFGGAGTGVVHLNNWLAENGYLRFARQRESLVKRAALALTPAPWQGKLFRTFPRAAAQTESASRFAGIDWSNTQAWSEELNYFPSIRINLAGRNPDGIVPKNAYTEIRGDVCRKLEAWETIRRAWLREELYDGPYVDRAPDIVLEPELEDGYSHSFLRSRGGPPFRRLEPGEYPGGKERGMNGTHRPHGVLMLSQPASVSSCSLLDVAPTVFNVLGVQGPAMEGRSLLGDADSADLTVPADGVPAYTMEQEAAVEARLRDLGYFE